MFSTLALYYDHKNKIKQTNKQTPKINLLNYPWGTWHISLVNFWCWITLSQAILLDESFGVDEQGRVLRRNWVAVALLALGSLWACRGSDEFSSSSTTFLGVEGCSKSVLGRRHIRSRVFRVISLGAKGRTNCSKVHLQVASHGVLCCSPIWPFNILVTFFFYWVQ